MRCHYYSDGYCFYNGDTGEECDRIEFGTNKEIRHGYCPKEATKRELKEHANYLESPGKLENSNEIEGNTSESKETSENEERCS